MTTVGDDYHVGLTPYMRSHRHGYHQLVPTIQEGLPARADRAYDVVTKKYRWGGADVKDGKAPYFDETARRMLLTTRSSMLDVASELVYEGDIAANDTAAKAEYKKALEVVDLLDKNLNESAAPYGLSIASTLGQVYCELGDEKRLNDKKLTEKGLGILLEPHGALRTLSCLQPRDGHEFWQSVAHHGVASCALSVLSLHRAL